MMPLEQLREMIRAEVAKHDPIETTSGTLELLAESSIRRAEGEKGQPIELVVRDIVAGLRQEHPTFFKPAPEEGALPDTAPDEGEPADTAPPEDEPAPSPAEHAGLSSPPSTGDALPVATSPPRDWLLLDAAEGASSPPEPSVSREGGLSLLWQRGARASTACASRARDLGHVLAAKVRSRRDSAPGEEARLAHERLRPLSRSRYAYAAVAGVLSLAFFASMLSGKDNEASPAGPATSRNDTQPASAPETTGAVPQREARQATAPESGSVEPASLRGVAEVLDTATLRIDGKVVRLDGVEWARGGKADQLTRYLRGRQVACELASAPGVYRCRVDEQDLSKVVLFNGGGRAASGASPDLIAAEKHAQSEQVGIWRK